MKDFNILSLITVLTPVT